jgi:hypothetical protein
MCSVLTLNSLLPFLRAIVRQSEKVYQGRPADDFPEEATALC